MIRQPLQNLVSNAIKYTPRGGTVHVEVTEHEENKTVSVAVGDTGDSMPSENLVYLFDKFYRLADPRRGAGGLRLNLVKHIVETVDGGKRRVGSEIGKGTTFVFTLPMATKASRRGL